MDPLGNSLYVISLLRPNKMEEDYMWKHVLPPCPTLLLYQPQREREIERQTGRQTERQRERVVEIGRDRETDRQKDRLRESGRDSETDSQTDRETKTESDRDRVR